VVTLGVAGDVHEAPNEFAGNQSILLYEICIAKLVQLGSGLGAKSIWKLGTVPLIDTFVITGGVQSCDNVGVLVLVGVCVLVLVGV
jgi:hypothetical protein